MKIIWIRIPDSTLSIKWLVVIAGFGKVGPLSTVRIRQQNLVKDTINDMPVFRSCSMEGVGTTTYKTICRIDGSEIDLHNQRCCPPPIDGWACSTPSVKPQLLWVRDLTPWPIIIGIERHINICRAYCVITTKDYFYVYSIEASIKKAFQVCLFFHGVPQDVLLRSAFKAIANFWCGQSLDNCQHSLFILLHIGQPKKT